MGFFESLFKPRPRGTSLPLPRRSPAKYTNVALQSAVILLSCQWTSCSTRLSSWSVMRPISTDSSGSFIFAHSKAEHTQWRWSDAEQMEHWGSVAVPRAAGAGSEEVLNSSHGHVTSGILNQDIFCPIAIKTQDLRSHSI